MRLPPASLPVPWSHGPASTAAHCPQDAYYTEGLKLPLILPLFLGKKRLEIQAENPEANMTVSQLVIRRASHAHDALSVSRFSRRDNTLMNLLGGDELSILGFRWMQRRGCAQGCVRSADDRRRRGGVNPPPPGPLRPMPRMYSGKKRNLQKEKY